MIGGLKKTTSRFAIAAAFAAFASTGAMAADLGGNCCSDLEERIAELEATTARKGNRKVSLEVSGHVNEAVLYWDDGVDDDIYQITNVQSRTRFRFKGSAKINSDWSAGFLIELGMTRPGSSLNYDEGSGGDDATLGDGIDVRHQAMYVKSKSIGTVWLGHTSDATDGITQICLGCTMGNYNAVAWGDIVGDLNFHFGALDVIRARDLALSAEGGRTSLVKYISPELAGFVLSAHWADDDVVDGDGWGVALRYANEFNGIRIGAGIGYSVTADEDQESTEIGGSVSVMHTATGLYISASYGEEDDEGLVGDFNDTLWAISAGMNRKFSPIGKTHIGFYYGDWDISNGTFNASALVGGGLGADVQAWGIVLNQKIDAAAMEVYFQYHNIGADVDVAGGSVELEDINLFMVGSRIRF